MPTEDVIDRRIRRAICKILWNVARGERPGASVRFRGGQLAAVDKAAVELMEMYEVAADQVVAEMYEDWTKANNWADPSEEHFAWLMAGESLGMVREAIFENLCNGRIPQFSIELRDGELAWTGDLAAGDGEMGVIAAKVVKRNPLIPSEEDYLGETLGAPQLNPHPDKVNRSISSFAEGIESIGKDGVEMLWRAIGVATKDGTPVGTLKGVVNATTIAVLLPDGTVQNFAADQVYPYEIQRKGPDLQARFAARAKKNPPAAWRREEFGKGYRAPDEVGDVGNYRTVTYPKGGVYADEMRGSMTRLIEQGDPFQRGSIAPEARPEHPFPVKDKERLITRGQGKPPWLPNPAGEYFFVGHMTDPTHVQIDAEHGTFDTLGEARAVGARMDNKTRWRSVIVEIGKLHKYGHDWNIQFSIHSITDAHPNPAHDWPASEVQSLLFDKHKFSSADAKRWATEHGFRHDKIDTTDQYHRMRQFTPTGAPCRTVTFREGVKAILCSSDKPKGKPPWLPNPSEPKHVALSKWRVPTIDELAKAWAYIEAEYTLKEGNIDGEQWAEALAFVASHPSRTYVDADDRRAAQEMFPQLTEWQWREIAARADYLLKTEGERPRFTV